MKNNFIAQPIENSGRLHWYHWTVVVASLGLTLGAWHITSKQVHQKTENQFSYQANQTIELVKERMNRYEDALWSGVATIHAEGSGIDYLKWRTFSKALSIDEKYPGIHGIGVIKHITPTNLDSFLAKEQVLRPEFKIHPAHEMPDYWPITYIEPIHSNEKALGLDMAHESNRHEAAKLARDTGNGHITAPIVLVQDAKKTPGFLFYVPYYDQLAVINNVDSRREHFVGLVYAPFIIEELMQGTLENNNRLVNFSIQDGEGFLYDELHHGSEDYDSTPLHSIQKSIEMYGRDWIFEIQSSELFRSQQIDRQPQIILIGGLVIDSLLLGMFLLLTRLNKSAIKYANDTKKELTQSEAFLNTAIHSSSAGFAIVNRNGCFVEINNALCSWLGYERDELLGEHSIMILSEKYRSPAYLLIDKMISGESTSAHAERQYVHKDGSLVWGLVSAAVVIDDENSVSNIVYHVANIQSEKELLANLQFQNKELEKSNADLEQFAYIASHDLKSPLNAIQQLANWIEEDCRDVLPKPSLEHLNLLMTRSQRMGRLLEDLLSYSKVNRYDYEEEPVNLKSLIDDQHNLIDKSRYFTCVSPDIELSIPKVPLEIVIRNLLSNAIKHHDKGHGEIQISLNSQDHNYIITVTDDGPGIPPNMQSKVVDMFQTLKPRDDVEGSGMGLAIIKRIVNHYRGDLFISSDGVRNTEFTIKWPIVKRNDESKIHENEPLMIA